MLVQLRGLAEAAFSRAAGAPLVGGNRVRLLEDARENYPRWLEAIAEAKHYVLFDNYLIHDDAVGRQFADALADKARQGISVHLIYDWVGCLGKASRRLWRNLRSAGVAVRAYNPPRLGSPLGLLSRDHRKTLSVDGSVGFVSGLCVGQPWVGDPARRLEPWRDTGVEIRGPAVWHIERAFASAWALTGEPMPELGPPTAAAGDVSIRIVATEPATAGMLRLDQMVASLAQHRLWLTDPYFSGTTTYVQALRAAAHDGVDVRLLVPGATDIPLLKPFSQAGYRTLLEAGVRIFSWNGTMVHAKTAVADGHWARVGSTNLNLASWLGNCELDAVIEDDGFAAEMEAMYLRDLEHTTEIVLTKLGKLRSPRAPHGAGKPRGRGNSGRVAAGAVRVGRAIGAALSNHRLLGPVEARLALVTGLLLCLLAVVVVLFPRALAYAMAALALWAGVTFLVRGLRLYRKLRHPDG
jgi:cardiolipin synthase A/B